MQILVIDDDEDIGELISATANNIDFDCIATTNISDFMKALNPATTLIMLDLIMPETDGIELLRILGQQNCKSKIILMSGLDKRVLETAENLSQTLGLFVIGTIQKPFRTKELEAIFKENAKADFSITSHSPILDSNTREFTKAELQQAIDHEEFVVYYQPQIEIGTGLLIGVEALARWQHPKHGLVLPEAFIRLLESFKLIDQLGWIVAKKSLSEFKQLVNKDGITPTLAINVSPYSLHDLQFPDLFIDLVKQNNIKPESIILEITESSLFEDLSAVLDILTRLRMKQFNLSIDDFGTGYAMMEQLQNVPATELKIDKSLIEKLETNHSTQIMITKIIEMGHELGIRIVAEGVETATQLEFLRKNKCDVAQGFLFTHPLAISELLQWIKKYGRLNY